MISLFSLSPAASPPRPPLSSAGTFGVSFTPATTGFLGSGSVVPGCCVAVAPQVPRLDDWIKAWVVSRLLEQPGDDPRHY